MRIWPLVAMVACTSMPPSGRPLSPVSNVAPPLAGAPATPAAPRGPQGDASAFDDERNDAADARPTTGDPDPEDKLARMAQFAKSPPAPSAPVAAPTQPPLPGVAAPIWDPSRPLPETSFGVRVLGVLLDLNPPRAVLGLPDGREQVVTAGAMLPAEGVVVLAIGRDAVQIARITPQGFYARVETDTVMSLAPSR
jgi:hypothetical protein